MSSVVGIDFSTRAIDIVHLDETADTARWHSIPLERGIAGTRRIRHAYAWARELEDAYLVAIEDPFSAGRAAAKQLGRACGAILASLPANVPDEHVWLLRPDEWRIACGLSGGAGKTQVAAWARERFPEQLDETWSQDAVDALCVAFAAREINAKAIREAA